MTGIEIPLFPENAHALTVATTVFVGVWVVAFFNFRFGWTLSGLVVPGYLTPLLIAKPISAAVIFVEAILTYWIVHTISERPRFLPCWCSFFGRDRFLALLLMSVLVRAVCDGWVLPWLGQLLDERLGIAIDYRNDLHSYGLIVVALIANYFWKPGLRRSVIPMTAGIAITYFITQYVLVGLTNFNVGDLQHTYEDISSSLLASPKAYIVIVTTSYVASWMNLRYSWEFNGILVPAMLGLLWHEPSKIVFTIGEALVLLGVGTVLLRLPICQRTTMTGGRKLLFFFSICYGLRLATAHLMPIFAPDIRLSDVFGFGFLLTTLIAVKAHDKNLTIQLVRGTIQVSMMGTVAASFVGFLLTQLPSSLATTTIDTDSASTGNKIECKDRSLVEQVRTDKVLLYQMRARDRYQTPVNSELVAFRHTLDLVTEYSDHRQPDVLNRIVLVAAKCNYEVSLIENRYLYLRERSPVHGWGIYVFNLDRAHGLCLEIPAPLSESSTIESGLLLFEQCEASAMAIAGADRQTDPDGSSDVLTQRGTVFSEFHRSRSRNNVVQVRGHTLAEMQKIARLTGTDMAIDLNQAKSQLWVSRSLPVSLRPKTLQQLVPGFELFWQDTPFPNILRDRAGGFAELRLSHSDRRKLSTRLFVQQIDIESTSDLRKASGHLHEWMVAQKDSIAKPSSGDFQVATIPEMLFFDQEILTPLFRVLSQTETPQIIHGEIQVEFKSRQELLAIQAAANALNYELVLFHDDRQHGFFVILRETSPHRYWGTFVFRWHLAEPYIVEVPRPIMERHVFDFGITMFDRPAASALLVAGAHPRANQDGTSDLIRTTNKVNLLNLVRQVLLREIRDRPMMLIQTRAIRDPTKADVVIATDLGTTSGQATSPLTRRLVKRLRRDGMTTAFADGSFDTAGYEVSNDLRAATSGAWPNKEVATLWLSPAIRTSYRDHSESHDFAAQCVACDIPIVRADIFEMLSTRSTFDATHRADDPHESLMAYLADPDVVLLSELHRRFSNLEWTYVLDRRFGQAFLFIAVDSQTLPLIVRVSGDVAANDQREIEAENIRPDVIDDFVRSRATVLRFIQGGGR